MRKLLNALKSKLLGDKPQVERRNPAKLTRAPEVGECIVYHHLKMKITETKSNDLLKWLLKHGWRPVNPHNDRRSYLLLPADTYAKLDLTASSERPMMVRSLMRKK